MHPRSKYLLLGASRVEYKVAIIGFSVDETFLDKTWTAATTTSSVSL